MTTLAMLVAGLMLAHQVAGKAARDGLFLAQFSFSHLPEMVIAGSVVSIVAGLLNSRILQALTPARMVPGAFLFSAVLHFVEWNFRGPQYRSAMVVAVYIHVVGLGAIVLSSFWSLLNEQFDPRTGKKYFGRIAGAGTLGGILGGVAAERFAVLLPPTAILLFLGSVHLLCGVLSFFLVRRFRDRGEAKPKEPEGATAAPWTVFRQSVYIRMLARLVLLGTTTAALLDIVFKTQAATLIERGPGLLRFFAIFYTAGQVFSFVVQTLVTRKWLEKQGLARGVGSLPAVVGLGGMAALLAPAFPVLVVTRGLEIVLRGSVFRAGYELFYTPLSLREKRTAKPIIDVVFDRMGDALGGATAQLFLTMGGALAVKGILFVAVVLAGVALFVTRRLEKLYIRVLEKGLVERALELDVNAEPDLMARSMLLRTLSVNKEELSTQAGLPESPPPSSPESRSIPLDPVMQRLLDLRSGHPEVVRRSLEEKDEAAPLDPLLAPQIILLLAWDEMAPDALRVLRKHIQQMAGQLVDTLLDEHSEFAIRRRIPRALAYSDEFRAVQGLMQAMNDTRFEVRFQCARALDVILQRKPEFRPPRETVFAIIERELSVGRGVWESRRLLDSRQSSEQFLFLDNVLRERANLSWEHLFSLLALILPREPLQVAFQALHTQDQQLRGLALEYLESVLPPSLRKVQSILETTSLPSPPGRATGDVAARLMQARPSVSMHLAKPDSTSSPDRSEG
ncbi:MAG: hypothetical protein JST79_11795 [Acidobacteria bacterium]|nr:hypothetical protein [Acidobacteriota bacterium]